MPRTTRLERAALAAVDPAVLAAVEVRERGGLRRLDDRIWAITTLRPFRTWLLFGIVAAVPVGVGAALLTSDRAWFWVGLLYGVGVGMIGALIGRVRLKRFTLPMLAAITDVERVPPFLEAVLAYLADVAARERGQAAPPADPPGQ